jgi:hypothetical protein
MTTKREEVQEQLKKQIDETVQAARTLRDQIRVDLHLASLDAKQEWKRLEVQFADAERFGQDVSEAAKTAANSVLASLREFQGALKRHREEPRH